MKRFFRFSCAIFLILVLCSLQIAAFATADPDALTLSAITLTPNADERTLNLTLHNGSNAAIDEFGIALAFLDENGYRIFAYADTLEGYTDEVCNWYYTPEDAIAPGEDYKTEDVFSGYAGTTDVGVAIRYYHKVNSDYILLPESEWVWQFSGYDAGSGGTNRVYYTDPPSAVYEAIDGYNLGYSYYLLDDFNASYYGKNQGGEWITKVVPGTPAADAGFTVGDLILFADGVKPTENVYAVEYAMLAVVNGEKVEWVYERDGAVYTTRISVP